MSVGFGGFRRSLGVDPLRSIATSFNFCFWVLFLRFVCFVMICCEMFVFYAVN